MEHFKGDRLPSIYDTIRIDGVPFDLTGATVKAQMRLETSSTKKVDAAATVISASSTLSANVSLPASTFPITSTTGFLDSGAFTVSGNIVFYTGRTATSFTGCTTEATGTLSSGASVAQIGGVRYDWASADVDMADAGAVERADYVFWWEVTVGGKTQKTPAFPVVMVDAAFGSVDLCNLSDVREVMESWGGSTFRDELALALIPIASRHIMNELEREFAPVTASATRRFRVYPNRCSESGYLVSLAPYDLRSVTSATLNPEESSPTTLTSADYILEPMNAPQGTYLDLVLKSTFSLSSTVAINFGFAYLDITGAWGFASVPGPIKQMCALRVRRWMQRIPPNLLAESDDPRALVSAAVGGAASFDEMRLGNAYRRSSGAF